VKGKGRGGESQGRGEQTPPLAFIIFVWVSALLLGALTILAMLGEEGAPGLDPDVPGVQHGAEHGLAQQPVAHPLAHHHVHLPLLQRYHIARATTGTGPCAAAGASLLTSALLLLTSAGLAQADVGTRRRSRRVSTLALTNVMMGRGACEFERGLRRLACAIDLGRLGCWAVGGGWGVGQVTVLPRDLERRGGQRGEGARELRSRSGSNPTSL